jgi:CheY-like chemotaxis protein
MSIDDAVKLIDAMARLITALIWPCVIAYIFIRFGPALREFVASLGELSVKGAGFEATAKRKAEAAAALAAAVVSRAETPATPEAVIQETRAAADAVSEVVTRSAIRRAVESTILWVDDKPEGNVHEQKALEALGVSFAIATSTDEALDKLARQSVDAIITDMSRPPDSVAGYTLLDALRTRGIRVPVILYTRSSISRAEARAKGAYGATTKANELFSLVVSALGKRAQS